MNGIKQRSLPRLAVQPAAKRPFSVRAPYQISNTLEKARKTIYTFSQPSRSSRWHNRSCSCRDTHGSDQNPTPSPTPQHGRSSCHSQISQRRPRPLHRAQRRRPLSPLPRRLPHRSSSRNQPSRKLHRILLPQILPPTPPRGPIFRVTFLSNNAYRPHLGCHGSIE